MRAGILTYHEGLNHGAYLQAFALMRVLQGFGHEASIINYKNRRHWYLEDIHPWLKYRRPSRFADGIAKKQAFRRDQRKMVLTPFTTDPDVVKSMHYDVVVIGSDVVWNYGIFGFDDLYFGQLPAARTVAYAPSFGWIREEARHPVGVAEGLRSFTALSARDANTQQIVESLTGESVPLVLDPTLIYDFSADEIETSRCIEMEPYILVYCYINEPAVVKRVREFARDRNARLVSLGYRQSWCDMVLMDVGPLEWLSLYRHADSVVSSTYHGTIFALKYRKNFLFVKNDKVYNRVASLAELCGLADVFWESDEAAVYIEPDYDTVFSRLESHVKFSKNWLRNAVQGAL